VEVQPVIVKQAVEVAIEEPAELDPEPEPALAEVEYRWDTYGSPTSIDATDIDDAISADWLPEPSIHSRRW
jgi:hypothetical protein